MNTEPAQSQAYSLLVGEEGGRQGGRGGGDTTPGAPRVRSIVSVSLAGQEFKFTKVRLAEKAGLQEFGLDMEEEQEEQEYHMEQEEKPTDLEVPSLVPMLERRVKKVEERQGLSFGGTLDFGMEKLLLLLVWSLSIE